jgi:hypothetical protein
MGHKWFYLWSIRGHLCDSIVEDAFRYFQIIQLLENTNGHEWVINDFYLWSIRGHSCDSMVEGRSNLI